MKRARSKLLWQGSSWDLRLVKLMLPDGSVEERAAIEHPGSVILVPIRPSPNGTEVLMLRQYRYPLDEWIVELPAGTRETDEPWLACAQRELREETGFRADTFTGLGNIWPLPSTSDEVMMLYLAEGLTPDPLPGDKDEELEITPMLWGDVVAMAEDGRLQDAKSIIAILRAARHLSSSN